MLAFDQTAIVLGHHFEYAISFFIYLTRTNFFILHLYGSHLICEFNLPIPLKFAYNIVLAWLSDIYINKINQSGLQSHNKITHPSL